MEVAGSLPNLTAIAGGLYDLIVWERGCVSTFAPLAFSAFSYASATKFESNLNWFLECTGQCRQLIHQGTCHAFVSCIVGVEGIGILIGEVLFVGIN